VRPAFVGALLECHLLCRLLQDVISQSARGNNPPAVAARRRWKSKPRASADHCRAAVPQAVDTGCSVAHFKCFGGTGRQPRLDLCPTAELVATPVSTHANNVRKNNDKCIEPKRPSDAAGQQSADSFLFIAGRCYSVSDTCGTIAAHSLTARCPPLHLTTLSKTAATNDNPYEPPQSSLEEVGLYALWKYPFLVKSYSQELDRQIAKHTHDGWQFVTTLPTRHVLWRHCVGRGPDQSGALRYTVAPLRGFWKRLWAGSFGSWPDYIMGNLPTVASGWRIVGFCEDAGFVLRFDGPKEAEGSGPKDKYMVLRIRRVAWRTLFGMSWLPILENELNQRAKDHEVVAYVGNDSFLLRSTQKQTTGVVPNATAKYKLALCEDWKKVAAKGEASYLPWLNRMAEQGWNLVSHYEASVFLFSSNKPGDIR
jgi:hypothetical protein